ncbi:gamma-glutamyltransferase [Balneolales bacterium ANBcel1]|nr:gamma-glutamyltransferase [Balneolales bacterium ANBcel1]
MKANGVIAAGHPETVRAAEEMLKDGGNAFDAVVAAHLAACVAEPVLTSLAGGGFLLSQTSGGDQQLYDFFVQTPRKRRPPEDVEFFPITADFGETRQEFHIGMGSFATPGTVRGLYAIHRDLCSMPMSRLIEPAVRLARFGVEMNRFQAYIIDVVSPVFRASKAAMKRYARVHGGEELLAEGDVLKLPDFADCLEQLVKEGEEFFYNGEIARLVDHAGREKGGHVTLADFESYRVARRKPLNIRYRGGGLAINPGPSSGGTLIAFALKLLEESTPDTRPFGSAEHLLTLAAVQQQTDAARLDFLMNRNMAAPGEEMLDQEYMEAFRRQIRERLRFSRGTTHISVMDREGNTASLTTSNGEGCGRLIPGTGIMMNNMLGEEDLHPMGFGSWPENSRITSMMAPAILNRSDGTVFALGSGGSNRLRTAILQVILNVTDYGMSLEEAVNSPRIHCEKEFLSVEHGFDLTALEPVLNAWPAHKIWGESNLFFGGTHSVSSGPDGFHGVGDPRRGGVARVV